MLSWLLLLILTQLHLLRCCDAFIGSNGLMDVFVFAPFTAKGESAQSMSGLHNALNPGYSHMVAALMAMEDFNQRNFHLVELDPSLQVAMAQCWDIKFNLDTATIFFDTGFMTHMASRSLFDAGMIPSAIAGTLGDLAALDLSVMAQAARYPIVAAGATDLRLTIPTFNPFTTVMLPDMLEGSRRLVDLLFLKNRTDYYTVFYSSSTGAIQPREALSLILEEYNITFTAVPYQRPDVIFPRQERNTRNAMAKAKETGHRTILAVMDMPHVEIREIADAAEEFGMNTGDYVWVWVVNFSPALAFENNTNITKLLSGSVWTVPLDNFYVDAEDPFLLHFRNLSSDFIDQANAMNPIPPFQPGYEYANSFASLEKPEWGSGFMYDSVMTIGLGACMAGRAFNNTILGEAHLEGIRKVRFRGASGGVAFDNGDGRIGARAWDSVTWGAMNILPPSPSANATGYYTVTDASFAGQGNWTSVADFYFSNGETEAPKLLRTTPEQNYLPRRLRILGFVQFGIVVVFAFVTVVWVLVHRNHRVVRAAQPIFLCVIAFGAVIQSSAIVTFTFDEGTGASSQQLTRMCLGGPWVFCLGFILIYGALFCKLWRVNKVLQFSRRKIEIHHVAWPMLLLFFAAVLILSLWSAFAPISWQRREINDITGESIGACSPNGLPFMILLFTTLFIPAVLTAVMAWKTKDVDGAYSDSWWIFMLIVVQVEIIVIALPVLIILHNISTEGRFIGLVCLAWLFPMTTLLLVMLPKYFAHRRAVSGSAESKEKRGASGIVRVTGIQQSVPSAVSQLSTNFNRSNISSIDESYYRQEKAEGAENKQTRIVQTG